MSWTSILTKVVMTATDHMLQSSSPNTQNRSNNSNYVGRSCNVQHHQDLSRYVPNNSQAGNCSNCNNSSPGNSGNKKQSQKNFTRKQNSQSNDKVLKIAIPSDGHYEINIKRVDPDSAKMGQSGSKTSQNAQKGHSSNTSKPKQQDTNQRPQNTSNTSKPKQQDTNQRPQNRNQNQQNGNQNKQNGNQKQQNGRHKPNSNQGTAKFQNDHQANLIQVSTNANVHSQMKKRENERNHKPGNLKFDKNHLGNQNKGAHVNNEGMCNKPTGHGYRQTTWMYLGRLKVDTTEFEIKNYLQQKFPRYNFIVVALPLYKDAKLPCFKVNVENAILDDFQNLENWPIGVKITKFRENVKT